jgi:Cu/Zn superoxide dismutase
MRRNQEDTMSHIRPLLLLAAIAAAMLLVPTTAFAGPVRAAAPLTDLQLTTVQPTDGAVARAQVTPQAGSSTVTLLVTGLAASADGSRFGAHVHVGSCVAGAGGAAGPHFNIGGATGSISRATEVWLDFTVHGGTGSAVARVPFVIPAGGAGSIVIHALPTDATTGLAGPRLACLGIQL